MNIKRLAIEKLSKWTAQLRRNQRIAVSRNGSNKVNVGCGLSVAADWLNVDGSLTAWIANRPASIHRFAYRLSGANQFYSEEFYCETLRSNRFIYHNIDYGLPFDDKTIDFVFSSHFLEHLGQSAGAKFLAECFRVLKPSGVLRIGVPDLQYAWALYQRGEKERMLHDFFFTGTETGFSRHRYAYDFELLHNALASAGFKKIERCSFRQGRTPDLDVLDNRAEYTLFVEASPT